MIVSAPAPVDRIRAMPREERLAFYRSLSPGALAAVGTSHAFWARPGQELPPPGELAKVELIIGGRRAGKTWLATQLFLREWISGRARAPRIIAATEAAVLDVVISGNSGLWEWLPYELKARVRHDPARAFTASKGHAGVFAIPGLPPVPCISAEKPSSAIGASKDLTLADDPAAWVEASSEARAKRMFREARISTSEGRNPCVIIPTTIEGMGFLRRALSGDMAGVRKRNIGSARDNTSLSGGYRDQVIGDMLASGEGADLDGVERLDKPGALWKWAWIEPHRVASAPDLARVVVAVDPADSGDKDADETGIVVVGLGHNGRLYVLADYTAHYEAGEYAAVAAWAFRTWKADAIVCEMNRAESAVRQCMAIEAPNVPIVGVDATRSKQARAEPIAMLYREGRVSHVTGGSQISQAGGVCAEIPMFDPARGQRVPHQLELRRDRDRYTTLEEEITSWDGSRGGRSPNGIDALVWGCWYLMPPEGGGEWTPAAPSFRQDAADPRAPGGYSPTPSAYRLRRRT